MNSLLFILICSQLFAAIPKRIIDFNNRVLYNPSELKSFSFEEKNKKFSVKGLFPEELTKILQDYDIEKDGQGYIATDSTGDKRVHTYYINLNGNNEVDKIVTKSPLGTTRTQYYYRTIYVEGKRKSALRKMKIQAYVGKLIENKIITIHYRYINKVLVPSYLKYSGSQIISGEYPVQKRTIRGKLKFSDYKVQPL